MRLQRVTSGNRWMPEIDGLRFIAIATVILGHILAQMMSRAPQQIPHDLHYTRFITFSMAMGGGVPLFFVISGFILARPFLKEQDEGGKHVDLKFYYLRRVTRLEPPYLLSLMIYAAVAILFRPGTVRIHLLSLLSSVFYVHNLFPALPPINFVTWSLEVEIQFYLLAPFLARVFRLRNRVLRRSILLVAIATSALVPAPHWAEHGWSFPWLICYFLVGYLLADLDITQRPRWSSHLWDLPALLVWVLILLFPSLPLHPYNSFTLLTCMLLFLGFALSMFSPLVRGLLSIRWVALTGGMCYSIYLLHMLVISGLFPLTRRLLVFRSLYADYVVQFALLVPAIMLVSIGYYLLVERPCMDPAWPRKLLHRRRKETASHAGSLRKSSS